MRAPMNCQLIGRWRIVEADLWDGDYLDLVEPATMTIRADGRRNRVRRRAGRPRSVVSRLFRTLVGGVLRLSDQGVTLLEQFHVQIPVGRPPRGGDVT